LIFLKCALNKKLNSFFISYELKEVQISPFFIHKADGTYLLFVLYEICKYFLIHEIIKSKNV